MELKVRNGAFGVSIPIRLNNGFYEVDEPIPQIVAIID